MYCWRFSSGCPEPSKHFNHVRLAAEGFEDQPRGHYLNCAIKARALAHEEAVRRESDVTTDSVCSHPHLDP